MVHTTQQVTVGRVLHVYSNAWTGPRPGLVVNAFDKSPYANINVELDSANDSPEVRAAICGDNRTLTSIPVFDAPAPDSQPNAETHGSKQKGYYFLATWPMRT